MPNYQLQNQQLTNNNLVCPACNSEFLYEGLCVCGKYYCSNPSDINSPIVQRTGVFPDGTLACQAYLTSWEQSQQLTLTDTNLANITQQNWDTAIEQMLSGGTAYCVINKNNTSLEMIALHRIFQDKLLAENNRKIEDAKLADILERTRTEMMFNGLDLERYE